jgi:hypothetical protein
VESVVNPNPPKGFVHPVEAEFARLLSFYGIAWQYEPRTFPLATDEHGNVLEAITPDFYLPTQDVFIELTTLRRALAGLKHRKIRRMRQLYPNVSIKLIDRKQMIALLVKYGMEADLPKLIGHPEGLDGV